MIYGYARVSTKKQVKGNSLDDQKQMLLNNGCNKVIPEQYSGKTTNRPEFEKLLGYLHPGDTLMVCKIDRLARNLTEGINTIQDLIGRGVTVHILNLGVVDNSINGRLIVNILLSIAEWEREMILERTAAGKAIARQKPDYREGRPPKYGKEQKDLAMSLLASGHSYTQVTAMTGISRATLVRYRRQQKKAST